MKKLKFEEVGLQLEVVESPELNSYFGGYWTTGDDPIWIDEPGETELDPETRWALSHPLAAISFNNNASSATSESERLFGSNNPSLHNGAGDAFRHAYWSALNTQSQGGVLAGDFGLVHEDFPGNPTNERNMDINNNNYGIALANAHPDWTASQLSTFIYNAAVNGHLTTL